MTMLRKIMVVDDDRFQRELLSGLLRAEGFDVATAEDGRRCLESMPIWQPDLLLMDVQMPELDGFEVCRHLKQRNETRLIPIVLLTGLSAIEDRVEGIKAGADDFISKPFERTELLARVQSLLNLKSYTDELERCEAVLFTLARSIEGKDPYTHQHCERLSDYSALLGQRLGLDEEQIVALRRAGVVHDIGKVAVPDAILLKPTPLTFEEMKVMQEHSAIGERICSPLRSFRLVLPIIRHHHERMDGTGYPDHLTGDKIPLTARILQTVDIFDALTTDRPYHRALSSAEAFEIMDMEAKRGWRDAALLQEFRLMMASSASGLSSAAV